MKRILFLYLIFAGTTLMGQSKQSIDSIKIEYNNGGHSLDSTIVYVDGQKINSQLAKCYNSDYMDCTIKKCKSNINDKQYQSRIDIHLKNNYKIKPISLTELKKRIGVQDKGIPVIFTIYNGLTGDYETINEDYDDYLIDENFISKVIVNRLINQNENIDIFYVSLLTKAKGDRANTQKMRLK